MSGVKDRASGATQRARTSGVAILPSGGFESPEKMVWQWPRGADGIIEEMP